MTGEIKTWKVLVPILLGVAMVFLIGTCGGCGLPGGNFLQPVNETVLAALPQQEAKALAVYSDHHANIFDLRLHSLTTCPFLAYAPAYLMLSGSPDLWADFLYRFYKAKHSETNRCTCDEEIGQ